MLLSFSVNDFVLLTLIGATVFFDTTRKRIPNFLNFPAIILGLIYHTAISGFSGMWFSFIGLLVGLAIFFIPFAMGGMGGGDVKLMGAIGALQGWQFVLVAAVFTALVGGVMSLVYLIVSGRFLRALKKMVGFVLAPFFSFLYYKFRLSFLNRASIYFATHEQDDKEPVRMPYGVAIAAGVLILMVINYFQLGEFF